MASLINSRPSQIKSIILNIWAKTDQSAGGAGADDGDEHTGSNSTSRNARLFTALVRSSLHSPSSQPWNARLFTALVLHAIPEASASDLCMQVLSTAPHAPLPTGAVRDPRSERL